MKVRDIFWFCAVNYILWCALCLKYYATGGFYGDAAGAAFTLLFIPGHMAMFFAGLLALVMAARLIGARTAQFAAAAFGTAFTLFLIIDIFVYSQYRFHISLAMLELFFGPAGGEIFVFPAAMYALGAAGVAALVALEIFLTFFVKKIKLGKRAVAVTAVVIIGCFIAFNALYAFGRFFAVPSITAQVSYLPWANPVSINTKMRKLGFEPREKPLSMPKAGPFDYPRNPLVCHNDKKQNVLIIMVDSLRYDMFSPSVMPNTYAAYKKAHGYHFTRHISGGNATQAGVFSLFYSMPSTYWDASSHIPAALITTAQAQDYQLGIFTSAKLNSPEFHKNIFSSVSDLRLFSQGQHKYQRDESMQRDFESFVDNRDKAKPFFGFLFYDSPHGFEYPPGFKEVFTPAKSPNYVTLSAGTDNTPYLNRYKNSVNFVDSKLGELFAFLKSRGVLDNTIIIITGDHGQEVNDTGNNFWGHNSNFTKYQTTVPLLVFWPGKKGGAIAHATSHYDIVPTVMQDAFGCVNPVSDYSIGDNLFNGLPRPYALVISYTNKAVVVGDKVSVLNNYGSLDSYDDNYNKTSPVDSAAISDALKQMSVFYK